MSAVSEKFQPLYFPESAEELLTKPSLEMLMLGFTIGFKNTAVAMTDRVTRYDLSSEPQQYWQDFCKKAREKYGLEQCCTEWDRKVADILLGKRVEEYRGQRQEFESPFECHLCMVDMAELIRVADIPFAVLHGGQIRSARADWQHRVRKRLEELLPNQQEAVEELVRIAAEDRRASCDANYIAERHDQLKLFARQLEELLNNLYSERRAASEERLLKAVSDGLLQEPAPNWETLWSQLSEVLSAIATATGVDRIGFLQGSQKQRFDTELKPAGRSDVWNTGKANIGPFWEAIRHRPTSVAQQSWASAFRQNLGITSEEPCLLTTTVCKSGLPAVNLPSVLVSVGNDPSLPATDGFMAALVGEIGKVVSLTSNRLEVENVKADAEHFAAYAGHDVKTALHAATSLAVSIGRDIRRVAPKDWELQDRAKRLEDALGRARDKAVSFAQLPVREMRIVCELARLDAMPLIEDAMRLAEGIEADRGISVTWEHQPSGPVFLDADEEYLSTALHAILENAVKYSFEGKEVRVSARQDDYWFVIEISNYGVGIPPVVQLDIFEFGERAHVEDKFKDRVRSGTGKGLPIARRIVDAHGGTIALTSVAPKGVAPENDDYKSHKVTATIRLPLPRGESKL